MRRNQADSNDIWRRSGFPTGEKFGRRFYAAAARFLRTTAKTSAPGVCLAAWWAKPDMLPAGRLALHALVGLC